jgi:DNA polymerase-3 subunit delta
MAVKEHDIMLLLGRERLLKEEVVASVIERHIKSETARSFDLTLLRGPDSRLSDAIDAASTLPLAADKRIVIVQGFDEMTGAKELFERYPVPSDSAILVLCSGDGEYYFTLDKGFQRKFDAAYGARGLVKNFYAMRSGEVREWVMERARLAGRTLDPDAAAYMLEKTGENLSDLGNEVQKLLSFVPERQRITIDDARQVLSSEMDSSVERIRTCVVRKDTAGCLKNFRILSARSAGKKEYLFLLADLSRYFRKLLSATVLMAEKGYTRDRVAALPEFGLKFYEAKNLFLEALSRFAPGELRRDLSLFYPMDKIVKSQGDSETSVYFERLLIALCGQGRRPKA